MTEVGGLFRLIKNIYYKHMFFCGIISLTAPINNKEENMEKDKIILYQEDKF